jgi:hypothetical protein
VNSIRATKNAATFVTISTLLCGVLIAAQADSTQYVFEAVIDKAWDDSKSQDRSTTLSTVIVDRHTGHIVIDQTMSSNLLACPKEWDCIIDDTSINFVVPRAWNGKPDSWTYRGVRYRVVWSPQSHEPRQVFSVVTEVLTNTTRDVEFPNLYVYDLKKGLIAFRTNYASRDGKRVPAFYLRINR